MTYLSLVISTHLSYLIQQVIMVRYNIIRFGPQLTCIDQSQAVDIPQAIKDSPRKICFCATECRDFRADYYYWMLSKDKTPKLEKRDNIKTYLRPTTVVWAHSFHSFRNLLSTEPQ